MRRVTSTPVPRGLTLVELAVAMAVAVVLLGLSAPYFGEYLGNARLRESGNLLLTETLYAQSEAVKRNTRVRLRVRSDRVQVSDLDAAGAGADGALLRERLFATGVQAATTASVDFDSRGLPTPLGDGAEVALASSLADCSASLRCPLLRIDGGGAVNLCGNKLDCP